MTAMDRAIVLALIALAAPLGGCVMGDKGVSGVFTPTAIESPPSMRGAAGKSEDAPSPKPDAEPRRRSLSVPGRAQ